MLDTDTRRRIDAARDVLVGKVPDPKSQVEQITIALIYKFMDDMDAENEEWGGDREFFAGKFEQYRWASLVRGGLGGHEMLNRYAEAITRMPENPGIPPLFRSIFNNAFLPYRDPETLRLFLREIDGFEYSDSEALGDAFEYLLSVLGSQGDAGQFRTPRHIIDFMVAILDPKKDETVLDPACGTAGFMISAWKHILNANMDGEGGSALTPDERERLARNFTGYDISPDMVRLSLVNMYLHGFANPRILEYDTLTSEDNWHYHADVVLANPPFMNPKGGIRPHKRFSVQSTRSEVLFVDYMAEHLTPNGRAGIIVPEGVIFQSQRAHTQLRKMLVENYLVAVVSLPAGVFKPYSGVKTSILVLDKALARHTKHIAFFKVENDGYGLGDQRKPIEANDLPGVQAEVAEYLRHARAGGRLDGYEPEVGFFVARSRIAEGGDYNLGAERYREREARPTNWPLVRLGEIVRAKSGNGKVIKGTLPRENNGSMFPAYSATGQDVFSPEYDYEGVGIVISAVGAHCGKCFFATGRWQAIANTHVLIPNEDKAIPEYLFILVNNEDFWIKGGMAQPFVKVKDSLGIEIPLPPLDVQREIVAEVEGYQRVIDGARAVLDGYRPHVPVDPSWPVMRLGETCLVERGASPRPIQEFTTTSSDGINWIKIGDAAVGSKYITSTKERITPEGAMKSRRVQPGDFILSNSMSFGRPYIVNIDGCIHDGWLLLRNKWDSIDKDYLYYILSSTIVSSQFERAATGGVVKNLNSNIVRNTTVPLPPLDVQKDIASALDQEQALVEANHELITRMEARIEAAIGRVWGEG